MDTKVTIISSATQEVEISREKPTVIVGERINPTGCKKVLKALEMGNFDLIILGTMDAFRLVEQADFVRSVLALGKKIVVAALRLPYDLMAFPKTQTYLCTYGIQEPSMFALAKALFGEIDSQGKLPVSIPELYPVGYKK